MNMLHTTYRFSLLEDTMHEEAIKQLLPILEQSGKTILDILMSVIGDLMDRLESGRCKYRVRHREIYLSHRVKLKRNLKSITILSKRSIRS